MPPPPRRSTAARPNTKKQIPIDEAKKIALDGIAAGMTREQAAKAAGRSLETYRKWMAEDPDFRDESQRLRTARAAAADGDNRLPVPDFPTFCEELGQPLFPHQLALWDAIEGREPRGMHPSFRFNQGTKWHPLDGQLVAGRVIGNLPPGFAKTTTFSVNYTTWLIHKNPDIRIIVVCKDQGLAKQILGAVKFRLTSPVFREIHAKYAPEGGWKDPDASWTQTEIYVQGRGSGEKDPTMQALGIGGRIYGARSDVIILDDAVTLANVNEHEKQRNWLDQEVESRLDGGGLLAMLGTRISPVDLYSVMREVEDVDDELVYTYFSMPALIDEGDGTPETWVSLWPERFPPARLRKIRRDPAKWALVYQQQDVAEDATFNALAVEASINSMRFPGPMTDAGMGHRPGGMAGLYVVGGLDPATVGCTAMQVWGVDRQAQKRYVLDGYNHRNTTPQQMRDTVKRLTETYGINEWVIERNAFQRYLTQDPELTSFLRSHGCKLTEHYTTENKYDPDFGIQAMAQLFLTCGDPADDNTSRAWRKTPAKALIELPNPRQNAWVAEYINQLVTWQPSGLKQSHKTDLVMAGWFPLATNTPLWTSAGWKTMGTVEVGDSVATASGEMARVAALTPITHERTYRVTFSDGTSLTASGNHRWWIEPVAKGGPTLPQRWMSTDEMRTSVEFKRICIRNPIPVDGPEVDLPVDPYCLGAWLGDGDARQSTMYCHPSDEPGMRWQFDSAGYPTTDQKREMCFGVTGMRAGLVRAGVLANKHVPAAYLHGSRKQRLALLQGLMDTDGSVLPGRARCYFAHTNKDLVDAVQFLALSLGFRVNVQFYAPSVGEVPAGRIANKQPYWRVLFTADAKTENPFRLPRKADRVASFVNTKPHRRLVVKSIEPSGTSDVRCISVDHPSHVFLAGRDLIPTGNCEIAARKVLGIGRKHLTHMPNQYLNRAGARSRQSINLAEWRAQKAEAS